MSLINDATLERLRLRDEATMRSQCRVLRRTDTVVDGRVAAGDETQVGPTVTCRKRRAGDLRPRESEAIGRLEEETYGAVDVPLGTEVLGGDRIEVTTVHGPPGSPITSVETFEVKGTPVTDSYDTSLTVELTREG